MGNSLEKPIEQKPGNSPREAENEDTSSFFTCEICIEPMLGSDIFENKNYCAHPFCQDCMAKYIQVKVQEGSGYINCPGLRCPYLLDPLSCRSMISRGAFSRWCDILCESAALGFEKRSYCPNRDCLELIVNECGGTVTRTKCPKCKQAFCFQCKTEWHPGFGCREITERNDILFGELMERNRWRRCPHCGQCVELLRGCSVVKCRCKTKFCYICGRNSDRCGCHSVQRVTGRGEHLNFMRVTGMSKLLVDRHCGASACSFKQAQNQGGSLVTHIPHAIQILQSKRPPPCSTGELEGIVPDLPTILEENQVKK